MNGASVLQLDGMTIPVETAGRSRRARLTIERDGSLRLRAAADVDRAELQSFLAAKREWIYKKLAEKEAFDHEPVTKELVDGEGFQYLGRSYRLRISDEGDRVQLRQGRLVLPRHAARSWREPSSPGTARAAAAWLKPRITAAAERLRVTPGALDVADLGHKWGSATPGGRIRIHWAAMQLSPAIIDYIILHELAHLREPHHGPAFWQLLGRVQPDYEERKAELARVGSALWLGAVRSETAGSRK